MFEIFNYDENTVNNIGRDGSYYNITCKPVGYWSDVIQMQVKRNGMYDGPVGWHITMSHSSGGRDTGVLKSDLEAEYNFAQGMLTMFELGRMLEKHFDKFEANYEEYMAEREAEWERERAEKQAAIDADPAIGHDAAASFITAMTEVARNNNKDMTITALKRGSDSAALVVEILVRNRSNVGYRVHGSAMSKMKTIEAMSNASVRTLQQEAKM